MEKTIKINVSDTKPDNKTKNTKTTKKYKKYKPTPNSESQTINNTYTPEQMIEKIESEGFKYVEPEELPNIPLGSHIRYLKIEKDGTVKYRSGGFLTKNEAPTYFCIRGGGARPFSCQLATAKVYAKTPEERVEENKVKKLFFKNYKELIQQIENDEIVVIYKNDFEKLQKFYSDYVKLVKYVKAKKLPIPDKYKPDDY